MSVMTTDAFGNANGESLEEMDTDIGDIDLDEETDGDVLDGDDPSIGNTTNNEKALKWQTFDDDEMNNKEATPNNWISFEEDSHSK